MKVPRASLIELSRGWLVNVLVDNPALGHILSTRGSYPVYHPCYDMNRSQIISRPQSIALSRSVTHEEHSIAVD